MKRALRWLIETTLFGVVLYLSLVQGVQGAANIALFYIWYRFLISWGALDDSTVILYQSKGPSPIPAELVLLVDLTAVALLLWYGWLWSGGACLVGTLLRSRMHRPIKPKVQVDKNKT